MLSIFFLVFLVAMGVALFTYLGDVDDVDIFGSDTNTTSVKKINKALLEKVIGEMEERQKNFDLLKVSRPVVGDPGV